MEEYDKISKNGIRYKIARDGRIENHPEDERKFLEEKIGSIEYATLIINKENMYKVIEECRRTLMHNIKKNNKEGGIYLNNPTSLPSELNLFFGPCHLYD